MHQLSKPYPPPVRPSACPPCSWFLFLWKLSTPNWNCLKKWDFSFPLVAGRCKASVLLCNIQSKHQREATDPPIDRFSLPRLPPSLARSRSRSRSLQWRMTIHLINSTHDKERRLPSHLVSYQPASMDDNLLRTYWIISKPSQRTNQRTQRRILNINLKRKQLVEKKVSFFFYFISCQRLDMFCLHA